MLPNRFDFISGTPPVHLRKNQCCRIYKHPHMFIHLWVCVCREVCTIFNKTLKSTRYFRQTFHFFRSDDSKVCPETAISSENSMNRLENKYKFLPHLKHQSKQTTRWKCRMLLTSILLDCSFLGCFAFWGFLLCFRWLWFDSKTKYIYLLLLVLIWLGVSTAAELADRVIIDIIVVLNTWIEWKN